MTETAILFSLCYSLLNIIKFKLKGYKLDCCFFCCFIFYQFCSKQVYTTMSCNTFKLTGKDIKIYIYIYPKTLPFKRTSSTNFIVFIMTSPYFAAPNPNPAVGINDCFSCSCSTPVFNSADN